MSTWDFPERERERRERYNNGMNECESENCSVRERKREEVREKVSFEELRRTDKDTRLTFGRHSHQLTLFYTISSV